MHRDPGSRPGSRQDHPGRTPAKSVRGERPRPEHPGQAVSDPIRFDPGALEPHQDRQADPASSARQSERGLGQAACRLVL